MPDYNNKGNKDGAFLGDFMCQELCLPFGYIILLNPPMTCGGTCLSHPKATLCETKLESMSGLLGGKARNIWVFNYHFDLTDD